MQPDDQLSDQIHDAGALVWKRRANRAQSSMRAVGGTLVLWERAMAFRPHALDRVTGGAAWSVALDEVASVGVASRSGGLFDGGLRKRLEIRLTDGRVERFVVNRLDQVVASIDAARSAR